MTDDVLSLPNEIWKPVIGYEGLYEISNLGRVKSFLRKKQKLMKLTPNAKTGYFMVTLRKDNFGWPHTVHSLVARMFIGEKPNGYVIDHRNGVKTDNRIENLEYVTRRENSIRGNGSSEYFDIRFKKKRPFTPERWYVSIKVNGITKTKSAKNLQDALIKREIMHRELNAMVSGVKNKDLK